MSYLNNLKEANNYTITENGATTHASSLNGLMDLFALGGAYRSRSDDDCINLFKKAFEEDESYAMKCLFYIRDIRGGQGERRFFRVIIKWLANNHPAAVLRNLKYVPLMGRWDDFYVLDGTPLENMAYAFMKQQFKLDCDSKTPSLLAKWLKSENTSSAESRRLARKTIKMFNMSPKEYRKTLATLRKRINVLERIMREGRWDEIEFDKIPSRAGIIYRNAFARNDITKARYEAFIKSKETKVNAAALYPVDIAHRAFRASRLPYDDPERLALQKYWDNLPNYYGDRKENGIAIVDVSGSMIGIPMEAAVSLGAYIAEKAHGPFANHFITFSAKPELVEFSGVDITDKLKRCASADWGANTNLEAVFDMLLNAALANNTPQEDMPTRLYIFSDMEFDEALREYHGFWDRTPTNLNIDTLVEGITKKWATYGYKMPDIVFWNLDARQDNIPAIGEGFSYVSGFSPVMIEQILSGKTNLDLVMEKLNSERYKDIH